MLVAGISERGLAARSTRGDFAWEKDSSVDPISLAKRH